MKAVELWLEADLRILRTQDAATVREVALEGADMREGDTVLGKLPPGALQATFLAAYYTDAVQAVKEKYDRETALGTPEIRAYLFRCQSRKDLYRALARAIINSNPEYAVKEYLSIRRGANGEGVVVETPPPPDPFEMMVKALQEGAAKVVAFGGSDDDDDIGDPEGSA